MQHNNADWMMFGHHWPQMRVPYGAPGGTSDFWKYILNVLISVILFYFFNYASQQSPINAFKGFSGIG